jgi:hypothetical protein
VRSTEARYYTARGRFFFGFHRAARENKAARMISMRLDVDDEANRHRAEIADCRPGVARLVGVLPGIDRDDAVLGDDPAFDSKPLPV